MPDILRSLAKKFGNSLIVERVPPGPVSKAVMETVLKGTAEERLLVLICLPPP